MMSLNVLVSISNWVKSRRAQGENPDPNVVQLMLLMYKTLDTLYLETRKLPFTATSGVNKKRKDNPNAFTFDVWLSDADYAALRSILGLAGDLISVSKKLKKLAGLAGLGPYISTIHKRSKKFADARDFFTHMDDHLRDPIKHGISAPMSLTCGIEFTANATNNVYLIWDRNILYFSRYKQPKGIVIDRPSFNEIFNQARQLYAEITNNRISQQAAGVMRPDQVYPP